MAKSICENCKHIRVFTSGDGYHEPFETEFDCQIRITYYGDLSAEDEAMLEAAISGEDEDCKNFEENEEIE